MGKFTQFVLSGALLLAPALSSALSATAHAEYRFGDAVEGGFVMAASSDGGTALEMKVDGEGRPSYFVASEEQERQVVPSAGRLRDWRLLPLAVSNIGEAGAARGKWEINRDYFEIYDTAGNSKVIGSHEFLDFWSGQGVAMKLNDAGQALVLAMEDSGVYGKISTLYFYDGSQLTMLTKIEGNDALAGIGEIVLHEDGSAAWATYAENSHERSITVRESDGTIRAGSNSDLPELACLPSLPCTQKALSAKRPHSPRLSPARQAAKAKRAAANARKHHKRK